MSVNDMKCDQVCNKLLRILPYDYYIKVWGLVEKARDETRKIHDIDYISPPNRDDEGLILLKRYLRDQH